jgi:hypothetical protein
MAAPYTPPATEENYQALAEAYGMGAESVRYGNKEIKYRSTAEMEQILYNMAVSLGKIKPNSGRTYAEFCKD